MNAIFKEPFPPIRTLVGAMISGAAFAWVFYGRPRSNDFKDEGTGQFTQLLAGVIIIAGLDILLFNFTARDLVNLNINLRSYEEILYAQGATALIIILLTPLHKSLAPLTGSPKIGVPSFLIGLYGWTRFLFVSLFLNLFVVYLSTHGLPLGLNMPKLADISLGFTEFSLTLPMAGAFTAGIAVASIFYWPPTSRRLKGHFGVLRLFLVILCVISIGFMYRIPTNPQDYLNAVIVACVAMVVATPVQRSFS